MNSSKASARLVAKELAIQFGQLLDDRNLTLGPLLELDSIAILAGAESWTAFRDAPECYRGRPDCKELRAQAVFDYLNRSPERYFVSPSTFSEILGLLSLPDSWR